MGVVFMKTLTGRVVVPVRLFLGVFEAMLCSSGHIKMASLKFFERIAFCLCVLPACISIHCVHSLLDLKWQIGFIVYADSDCSAAMAAWSTGLKRTQLLHEVID